MSNIPDWMFEKTPNVPPKPWVGLDEVEIVGCTCECIDVGEFNMSCAIDFARAIEAKLKERNTNGQA